MNVEEMRKRAEAALVRCYACGGRATCVGAYEGQKVTEYCCDDCCGHGNEDGHCAPLEDVNAEPIAADVLTLLDERARLDALLAALRSVDERELPEHVAAALRAVNGSTKSA